MQIRLNEGPFASLLHIVKNLLDPLQGLPPSHNTKETHKAVSSSSSSLGPLANATDVLQP
jgi:hypothetical protein